MNIMNLLNIINAGIIIVGLPLILKATLYLGKRLQVLDSLEDKVNNQIIPDLKELRIEVSEIKGKVNVMWEWFSRHIVLEKSAANF